MFHFSHAIYSALVGRFLEEQKFGQVSIFKSLSYVDFASCLYTYLTSVTWQNLAFGNEDEFVLILIMH